MYQVLYRKYRPQTFEDVVGQPQVTITLKNELKSGRINHAYLFTGSRGTGKTTCAKILAKAVNCLNPKDSNPCGKCENCRGIDSGEILDVVEMDAASNRKIDNIRDIIDEVAFTPAKARYRVYIIDEVHMLTTEAFNALLKTLEEPPEHVIFILATTEVHKLPATITSRCQRFDFHRISPKDLSLRLGIIADKEGVSITDEAKTLISIIADGACRDAISLMDRCIGISDGDVTADIVRKAAGLAGKNYLFALCTCAINKNSAKALGIIDRLYNESKDIPRLCDELISHFRSLMMIKTVSNPRDILPMSDREFDAAQSQCDYLSLADIVYSMDVLSASREKMAKGINNRTELEVAIVKLCSPELEATHEALIARITALEKTVKALSSGAVQPVVSAAVSKPLQTAYTEPVSSENDESTVTQAAEGTTSAQPSPINITDDETDDTAVNDAAVDETVPEAEQPQPVANEAESMPQPDRSEQAPTALQPAKAKSEPDAVVPKQPEQNVQPKKQSVDLDSVYKNATPMLDWPEVINNIKQYSRAIAAAFEGSRAYISGDYLLIETDQEIAFQLLKQSSQRDNIRKAVQEITGRTYKLGPYKKPEAEKKPDDVLLGFIQKMKDSGINVTEEE